MKYLFITLLFTLPVITQAQVDINEYELVGKWVLQDYSGEFTYQPINNPLEMSRPDSIIFFSEENIGFDVGVVYSGGRYCDIFNSFISSYNPQILHLHSSEGNALHLRYRIISYNNDILELDTFDGKGHLVYKREVSPDNITNRNISENIGSEKVYSVQGYELDDKSQKGVKIIRKNEGKHMKVIR